MKFSQFLVVVLVSFAVALGTVLWIAPKAQNQATSSDTAYERVMGSNTLRCGYAVFPPYFTKDPATGAFAGIWHDFTEKTADHLGLKVIWAEEIALSDIGAALDSGRIDAFCAGLWTAGKRVRAVDFLSPSAYEPMLVYVRTDDHRFDADIAAIGDPTVRISTMDGEGGGLIATEDFPKAKFVSLPALSGYADMFNQVVANKADLLIAAPSGAAVFIKNNPGVLRPIALQPLRIFPVSLIVGYGQDRLRDMLNRGQQDILDNGQMQKIIARYEVNKGDFWPVAKPYAQP